MIFGALLVYDAITNTCVTSADQRGDRRSAESMAIHHTRVG